MFRFGEYFPFFDQDPGGGSGGGDESDEPNPDESESDEEDKEKTEREKELEEQLAATSKEIEILKKEKAGEFKRTKDLQRQIDEIKKAQMSEEERKSAEEAERQAAAQEEQKKFLDQCVSLAAEKGGVTDEDRFLLSADNQEDIFKKGDRLKALLAEAQQAGYDKAKKDLTKGAPPGGGDSLPGGSPPKLGATPLDSLNSLK